jgi:hypothetical protein
MQIPLVTVTTEHSHDPLNLKNDGYFTQKMKAADFMKRRNYVPGFTASGLIIQEPRTNFFYSYFTLGYFTQKIKAAGIYETSKLYTRFHSIRPHNTGTSY